MCDYSLESIASRPAAVGDELVSTRFGESITRGFSAVFPGGRAKFLRQFCQVAFIDELFVRHKWSLPER